MAPRPSHSHPGGCRWVTIRCTRNENEAKGVALDCAGSVTVSRPAELAALARALQRPGRVWAAGAPGRANSPHRRLLAWAASARGAVVRGWGSTSAGVCWAQAEAMESTLSGRVVSAPRSPAWENLLSELVLCLLCRIEPWAAPSRGDGARLGHRGVASPLWPRLSGLAATRRGGFDSGRL